MEIAAGDARSRWGVSLVVAVAGTLDLDILNRLSA
jgi:hypothetical protein